MKNQPLSHTSPSFSSPYTLTGIGLYSGIAIGRVVVRQPHAWRETSFAANAREERNRLKNAIRKMIKNIDEMLSISGFDPQSENYQILESYRLVASDRSWARQIQLYIKQGLTAEAALERVRRQTREHYSQLEDRHLKERLSDFEDLSSRLMRYLIGLKDNNISLSEPSIVVAQSLGPAELLDYDRQYVKGLILEEGVHTSHCVIIARALGIPIVGRIPDLLSKLKEGQWVIIEGKEGKVKVNPSPEDIEEAERKIVLKGEQNLKDREFFSLPAMTSDQIPIALHLNAGFADDLRSLETMNLEGVGLFRTEIPFMGQAKLPDLDFQTEVYEDVFDTAKGKPVLFRTFDIGGDKIIPGLIDYHDENPAMGWRGIRVWIDKPSLLKIQSRALIQACQGRELSVLFPMVATIEEFLAAKALFNETLENMRESCVRPKQVNFGIMLEVPSIIWQLPKLLPQIDFIAVGTNDLHQFFFACDRSDAKLSNRYDVLSQPFVCLLNDIWQECKKYRTPVTICGEMAGNPLEALALLAIGYKNLSMREAEIIPIKKMIQNLQLQELQAYFQKLLFSGAYSIRDALLKYVKESSIII